MQRRDARLAIALKRKNETQLESIGRWSDSEWLLYQTEDGQTRVQVRREDETVWLTPRQMAELFQKDVRTINGHIQNVYEEGELQPGATLRNSRMVQTEGSRDVERDLAFYNLDVIISVGYRVRSHRGTQFRIWATQRLREFIVKGFALDDQRLKDGGWTEARRSWVSSTSSWSSTCPSRSCRRVREGRCPCAIGSTSCMDSCAGTTGTF